MIGQRKMIMIKKIIEKYQIAKQNKYGRSNAWYEYAIYHAGMKEWWVVDDDSFIIHLNNLPRWSKGFFFTDEIDLRSYSWRELRPHSVPMKSYINNETITHMSDREWDLWIENEPDRVKYIDEILWVLGDAIRVGTGCADVEVLERAVKDMPDGIVDWLEDLKGYKYE